LNSKVEETRQAIKKSRIDSVPNENGFVPKTLLIHQIHEISLLIINPELYAVNGSQMYLP